MALITGIYHTNKSLPPGLSFAGPERDAEEVRFLRDLTYLDADDNRQVQQEIFDAVFAMIDQAERFVLVDMFLFNDFQGAKPETTRSLCQELTDHLIERRRAKPGIEIHVITDPINTVYGGMTSPHLEQLKSVGVHVTMTDLALLRDSNPVYSSFWRPLVKPFGNSAGSLAPNPFGSGRVSLRSYLAMGNLKANHRKALVADSPSGLVGLVTSANPHDGSSAHENVALQFSGAAAEDLLEAEEAVLSFSGGPIVKFDPKSFARKSGDGGLPDERHSDVMAAGENFVERGLKVSVVSEKQIEKEAMRLIAAASEIDLVMFYLSDRKIIRALTDAAADGAVIRIILDPNKDAFGHEKGGVPNRQVATELTKTPGIQVRWADTHGEQCHSKMLLTRDGQGTAKLLLGSANFTRRNLDDLNLELDASVSGPAGAQVFQRAFRYFEMAWSNSNDQSFTADYEAYRDDSTWKKLRYRVMEQTGLSSF